MKAGSEQNHLRALRVTPHLNANVYKACVAVANNGQTLPEEKQLSPIEKDLLEVRRQLFSCDLEKADKILLPLTSYDPLIAGDILFLKAQVYHRRGQQEKAAKLMSEAATFYESIPDLHRALRSRVNGALCLSSLESCLYGELFAFEQEARRQNFHDIAANICRTTALELLAANRPKEVIVKAMEASQLYQLDGYQDDRSVAILIASIAYLLIGETDKAQELRFQALVTEGKATIYLKVYEDLFNGKTPKVLAGHSLSKVNWKKMLVKTESVTGKIIKALKESPKTRDELISIVWGKDALNPSYCSRLYSAINTIRKNQDAIILFDGEYYKII